jgi:hypothetical protein
MPELPSRRRTATQDHPTTLGQYQWSQAAEAGVLTKMFQGTNHSRSSAYGDYTNFDDALTMPVPSVWAKLPSDAHDGATRHRQTSSTSLPTYPLPSTSWQTETDRLVLRVQLLAASVRDGCAPRGYTDTYTGRTSRAGEGGESRDDWEMKEPKEPKPALAQNGTASGNKQAAVV